MSACARWPRKANTQKETLAVMSRRPRDTMNKIPFGCSIHPATFSNGVHGAAGTFQLPLAKELHVSAPRVNDLVRASGPYGDTAMRLSAYFGCSAQLWLGLQMDHDLWLAAKKQVSRQGYAEGAGGVASFAVSNAGRENRMLSGQPRRPSSTYSSPAPCSCRYP